MEPLPDPWIRDQSVEPQASLLYQWLCPGRRLRSRRMGVPQWPTGAARSKTGIGALRGPARTARAALRQGLSSGRPRFELADVPHDAVVKEVDDGADARRPLHALMGHQPHRPAMIAPWRNALDEVGLGVGDDARQDR